MARKPDRIGWPYDPELEHFTLPSGQVLTLHSIAQHLQDAIYCRYDLTGPWEGWTVRGKALRPPHSGVNGPRLTPDNLGMFLRWQREGSAVWHVCEPAMAWNGPAVDENLAVVSFADVEYRVAAALLRIGERARL